MLLTDLIPIAQWIEHLYYRGLVPGFIGRWVVRELDKWYDLLDGEIDTPQSQG